MRTQLGRDYEWQVIRTGCHTIIECAVVGSVGFLNEEVPRVTSQATQVIASCTPSITCYAFTSGSLMVVTCWASVDARFGGVDYHEICSIYASLAE